jgi:hypothetical protein
VTEKMGFKSVTEKTEYRRPDKTSLLTQGPEGQWRMVSVSEHKARQLGSNGAQGLVKYIQAAFKGECQQTPEELQEERFLAVLKRTECLKCRDSGLIELPVERPGGCTYTTGFACNCEAGKRWLNSTGSMAELFVNGYKHPCQLAGRGGEGCAQKARCAKACNTTFCTKFDRR